jgi:hypothetical protein
MKVPAKALKELVGQLGVTGAPYVQFDPGMVTAAGLSLTVSRRFVIAPASFQCSLTALQGAVSRLSDSKKETSVDIEFGNQLTLKTGRSKHCFPLAKVPPLPQPVYEGDSHAFYLAELQEVLSLAMRVSGSKDIPDISLSSVRISGDGGNLMGVSTDAANCVTFVRVPSETVIAPVHFPVGAIKALGILKTEVVQLLDAGTSLVISAGDLQIRCPKIAAPPREVDKLLQMPTDFGVYFDAADMLTALRGVSYAAHSPENIGDAVRLSFGADGAVVSAKSQMGEATEVLGGYNQIFPELDDLFGPEQRTVVVAHRFLLDFMQAVEGTVLLSISTDKRALVIAAGGYKMVCSVMS